MINTPNDFELAIFNEFKKIKMENESLKKQLAENQTQNEQMSTNSFRSLMKNSYFHGVLDLYLSSGILRILWILILVSAIVLSAFGCYSVISEFIQSPVVISYFVREMGSHWILPDVIICPFNRFNRTYLEYLNVSEDLAQYLEMTYPSPVQFQFQADEYADVLKNLDKNQAELDELLKKIGNMSFTEFMKELAIDCPAFFPDNKTCDSVEEIMTQLGNCFKIPGKTQKMDGFGHGQRIVITLPEELYQPGVNQLFDDGIAVKLVAWGRGIDHDLSFIPPGVHAIMPLRATKFEFKDDPPRQFDKTVTYAKFPSKAALEFVSKSDWNKMKNMIILEIYIESFYFTLIKHVRVFTPSNFIAQIGGQLGLWIGGSIISIIQFLIYMIVAGYILIKKQTKRLTGDSSKQAKSENANANGIKL